jgi:hypothetical protein
MPKPKFPYAGDAALKRLLDRYCCPAPLHVLRMRFWGEIVSPSREKGLVVAKLAPTGTARQTVYPAVVSKAAGSPACLSNGNAAVRPPISCEPTLHQFGRCRDRRRAGKAREFCFGLVRSGFPSFPARPISTAPSRPIAAPVYRDGRELARGDLRASGHTSVKSTSRPVSSEKASGESIRFNRKPFASTRLLGDEAQ